MLHAVIIFSTAKLPTFQKKKRENNRLSSEENGSSSSSSHGQYTAVVVAAATATSGERDDTTLTDAPSAATPSADCVPLCGAGAGAVHCQDALGLLPSQPRSLLSDGRRRHCQSEVAVLGLVIVEDALLDFFSAPLSA